MTEQLKVTPVEEYAEKAREASAAEDKGFLHRLKKTGAVVRIRRANMEGLAMVGAIPMSLVSAAQGQQRSVEEIKKNPTPEEVEDGNKNLIFMRQTVVENCLEPRIGFDRLERVCFLNGKGQPAAFVHPDDFLEMFNVITGQEGADGLEQFPNRQERRASASKSRRRKVRPEPALASTQK